MRDPVWWAEFEREYNEKEDRLAEIRENYAKYRKEITESINEKPKKSLWRKRQIGDNRE